MGYYWIRKGKHVSILKVNYGPYFSREFYEAYQYLKTKEEKLAYPEPEGFYVPGGDSYADFSVESVDYEWAGPIPLPEN